ncbi:hypothetical protein N431DRAFT_484363 [Stipitochalara longipes BDJ]|nr:hypothetical protein N431DRAFT_484363 [Stipitochalara longipes BDJ]
MGQMSGIALIVFGLSVSEGPAPPPPPPPPPAVLLGAKLPVASMDCSIPDDAEASEVAELPDAVVPDAVGAEPEGTLLPLGTVANVLGEAGETVGDGLNDGVFKSPPRGSGIKDPEALEALGLAGSGVPGGRVADPDVDGRETEEPDGEPAGGELTETEPEGRDDVDPDGVMTTRIVGEVGEVDDIEGVEMGLTGRDELPDGPEIEAEPEVELELPETGLITTTGLLEDDPVGEGVESDEDELLVVTLTDPTVGLELEELPVGELIEEDELMLVTGGDVEETDGLELLGLGLGLDEDVGVVLAELEVVVDPQPEIVENTVAQKVSLSSSVQERDVPTQELLLAVTGGVVGVYSKSS